MALDEGEIAALARVAPTGRKCVACRPVRGNHESHDESTDLSYCLGDGRALARFRAFSANSQRVIGATLDCGREVDRAGAVRAGAPGVSAQGARNSPQYERDRLAAKT